MVHYRCRLRWRRLPLLLQLLQLELLLLLLLEQFLRLRRTGHFDDGDIYECR